MSRQFGLMHVAVGVVFDQDNKILIAKRPPHKTKAGFWEFPGGKVEKGETVLEALKRELEEETGIFIHSAVPFIKVHYDSSEHEVLLDTWMITSYTGNAHGVEGQLIKWIDISELDDYSFPEGNTAIITQIKRKITY